MCLQDKKCGALMKETKNEDILNTYYKANAKIGRSIKGFIKPKFTDNELEKMTKTPRDSDEWFRLIDDYYNYFLKNTNAR